MAMAESTYQELANLKVAPDAELVIGVDLSYGHPFMVGAHSSKLPVGEACTGRRERASCRRIVAVGCAGFPGVVRDFVVILSNNLVEDARQKISS